jgi:hypothetical protein
MAKMSVLAIGIDPAFADFSAFPDLTLDLVRTYTDAQIEQFHTSGFDAVSCLTDLGDTAESVVENALKSRSFDCVVIGAGLREPNRGYCCSRKSSISFTNWRQTRKFASTLIRPIRWKQFTDGSRPEKRVIGAARATMAVFEIGGKD